MPALLARLFPRFSLRFSPAGQNIFFLIILLLVGNIFTYQYLQKTKAYHFYYQAIFAPAVMLSCGQSFAQPLGENLPLAQFLSGKKEKLSCSEINSDRMEAPTFFQKLERYMLYTAAFMWKLFGLEWNRLIPIFLLFYSATLIGLYFIFRLALKSYLAFLFTGLLSLSSFHVFYVTQWRDYAVAPFIIGLLAILGALVKNPVSSKKLWICSSLAGLLTGIGLGFRSDLLLITPLFISSLIFFGEVEKPVFINKIVAILSFLLCFIVAGSPVLMMNLGHGGSLAHAFLIGLNDLHTSQLQLKLPVVYSLPYLTDYLTYAAINNFYEIAYGIDKLLPIGTHFYDHYGQLFLLEYALHFPADLITRVYASIITVPLLFIHGPFNGALELFVSTKIAMLPFFILATLPLFIVALYHYRLAFFLFFVLIYFGAYPVFQFEPRHYFYLEFIGWWCLGLFIQQLLFFISDKKNLSQELQLRLEQRGLKIVMVTVSLLCLAYGLLIGARYWQAKQITQLANYWLKSESQNIEPLFNKERNSYITLIPSSRPKAQTSFLETTYLKITVKENCPFKSLTINLNYSPLLIGQWGLAESFIIPSTKAGTFLNPIYNYYNAKAKLSIPDEPFITTWVESVEYSAEMRSCITAIAYIKPDQQKHLMLTFNLSRDWQHEKLYQIFS